MYTDTRDCARRVLILTDSGGISKLSRRGEIDSAVVRAALEERGCQVEVHRFSQIRIGYEWRDVAVLYQSSEDYRDKARLEKRYIEHVVHALSLIGARPIPSYSLLVAHGDKVFQELLRPVLGLDTENFAVGKHYGSHNTALCDPPASFPVVVKTNFGAGSKGVQLANEEDFTKAARIAATPPGNLATTWVKAAVDQVITRIRNIRRSREGRPPVRPWSPFRNSFVAQPFVAGLVDDYKVLVYGDRYFVLRREVRPADFRASGSGRFHFDERPPAGLLDFAEGVVGALDTPWVSLDIGAAANDFFLFEYQALNFGTTAIDKSKIMFVRGPSGWREEPSRGDATEAYVHGLLRYLRL